MNYLSVQNISVSFNNKPVLTDISFNVNKGEILSLLGKNGSGKSSLLKAMLKLIDHKGEVFLQNKNISSLGFRERANAIAYVPQTHKVPFAYEVFDVVLMGTTANSSFFGAYSQKAHSTALKALHAMGIGYLKHRLYNRISGGERQMVLIARALAQGSPVLLLDEPVTGLDFANQMHLITLLKQLAAEGYTIIQTTHYPDHLFLCGGSAVLLNNGQIMKQCTTKELSASDISMLYGMEVELLKISAELQVCIGSHFI